MSSLRDKTISGIFWSFLQNVGGKGINFIVMIVLARLLTPRAFGLIGMLMIFIDLSHTLIRSGFQQALIQKQDADDDDFSVVFYINLIVSILLYGVLYVSAPYISAFYDQPRLTVLTRVLSLVFVINSFSYIQESKLLKEIRFKQLTLVNIPSVIIGGVVSIVMAFMGYGVWSLVALQLISRFVFTVQIWLYSRWLPKLSFNLKKARGLFSYGSKLLLSSIFTSIYNNIYQIIIGKYFPVNFVGFYQNSRNLAITPSTTLTTTLNNVIFPVFSTIQNDDAKLKQGYRKVIQQAAFWICPIFILAGVLARPLFELLYTPKWLPAVPYFQFLCVVAIFEPLCTYCLNILNVKGRTDIYLKLQVTRRIITIGLSFLVIPFGIFALLTVQTLASIGTFCFFGVFSGKKIKYSLFEQIKDISKIFVLALIAGLVVFLFQLVFSNSLSNVILLIGGGGLGASCYWFLSYMLRISPYSEFQKIIKGRFKKA